jgi:DNA-binding IclR family transcriptional regulator
MARSSPSVQRVVAVINFFTDHPGQSFTLTDLVDALQLNSSTCHTLLAGLVEADYLYRTNDKKYILGPALAAVGRIATEHFSPLQVAHSEIRELANEFNAVCAVYFIERYEIITRARAAAMSQLGLPSSVGVRIKLHTSFAAIYGAWMSDQEVDTWTDGMDPRPSPEEREVMRRGMAFAREHGYCFAIRSFGPLGASDSTKRALADYVDIPITLASELDLNQLYSIAFIISPVFDRPNHVAFGLGMTGLDAQITGKEVERIGQQVREACERITRFIRGKNSE